MFEIRPVTREHLKELYGMEDADDRLQNDLRMEPGNIGFAALSEGRLIGAAGIGRLWGRTGAVWAVLSDEIKEKHKKTLHKYVLRLFPVLVERMNLERIQADAEAESPVNCAWLERLGFLPEGLMRKYKDGKDYLRFAWVRE